jgi:hypothetical protein
VRKDEADSFAYKEWQRGCIHDILHSILLPLQNVMEDGINLMCPDGQRRLCFPVIQQYIADYEEQRMLASILSGYCPKCTIPSHRKSQLRAEVDGQNLPQHQPPATYSSGMITYPRRDGDEAKRLRNRYRRIDKFRPNLDLEAFGYHETHPFTEHYPFSDIYEVLAPDRLHQILKLSYDRLASEWIQKVIEATENLSDKKAHGEIDARYTQIPPYPGLRHFTKGIFKTKRWTGNEHRAMMAVYAGVVKGIVPEACEALVKVWLDIIRMSHYKSHTDSTLQLLATAINSFWKQLWDSRGPFVKHEAVVAGWHSPKVHYFQHYTEYIRSHGSLSFCSTNRTEAWHKQIKEAYRRSNKGPQALEFVLRDEARRFAWGVWEDDLKRELKRLLHVEYDEVWNDDWDLETEPGDEDVVVDGVDGVVVDEDVVDDVVVDEDVMDAGGNGAGSQHSSWKLAAGKEWSGLRAIKWVREQLGEGYEGLVSETSRLLRWIQSGRNRTVPRSRRRDEDIEEEWGRLDVSVHQEMSLTYPRVHDPNQFISETVRSTRAWLYSQNKDWKKPRRDTALFRYGQGEDESSTMANRRVGRVLLLFKVTEPWGEHNIVSLAYVQWFQTVAFDKVSGMFRVKKMTGRDGFEVVEIETMERGAHLIPCFKGLGTKMADGKSEPALDMYNEFWLNNQIDEHMYNTIYGSG